MRQNLTLLLLMCSLLGFSQLYISEGILFSMGKETTILTTQEPLNIINANIIGQGRLYLNSSSGQSLTSTQAILELPTLHILNANLVHIKMALNIQNQMVIDQGTLTLSHDLVLYNGTSLVLGTDAKIHTTANGHIVYKTQVQKSHPLAGLFTMPLLKYIEPERSQIPSEISFVFKRSSNLGIAAKDYEEYIKQPIKQPPDNMQV